MSEEELKKRYVMLSEVWKMFKEFSNPDDTDEFWLRMRNRAIELEKEHQSKFMVDLAVAVMTEIDRIYKEREATNEQL